MRFSPEGGESSRLAKELHEKDLEVGLHEWNAEILEQQATTDPLTGLDNRRSFQGKLEQTLRMVRESKGIPEEHRRESSNVLALVAIDVDHFKKINDTLGHQVGDQVLVQLANLLRESVRGSDSIARFGGEEFMIIMPGANAASAARHAEELREKVASLVFEDHPDLKITSSFGVISSDSSDDAATLAKYADDALYNAKNNGRNQVVVYEDAEETEERNVA